MKVLMVTPSFRPILGGTETYVEQLTIALNRKGVTTDVMTFNMDSKWNPVKEDQIIQKIECIEEPGMHYNFSI